jgi:hypothetical protein
LHDSEIGLAAKCILTFELNNKVQTLIDDSWKRMNGIEGDGGKKGKEFFFEEVLGPNALLLIPIIRQ